MNKGIRFQLFKVFGYSFLSFITILIVFPIYWLFITSIKHEKDWASSPPVFFTSNLTFENFAKTLQDPTVLLAIKNTVMVSLSSTFLSLLFGTMVAYALTRIKFPKGLNNKILIPILLTRLFPYITLVFPYFIIIRNMHLLDTKTSLILSNTALFFPFVVWLMVGFFEGLPKEIEDAAMIDGCNMWQRFTKIALPLSINGIAVSGFFVFMATWNEFLFAVTFSSNQAKTLPVIISGFISDKGVLWGDMTTVSVISIIPVFILVFFFQKYLIRGLTFGAVK